MIAISGREASLRMRTGSVLACAALMVAAIAAAAAIAGSLSGCATASPVASPAGPPPKPNMMDGRFSHTATLLNDGTVLVAGGVLSDSPSGDIAEIFDPARSSFIEVETMTTARAYHTATLLKNGQVLVAGGADVHGRPLDTVELYDPARQTFTANTVLMPKTATDMVEPRFNHTGTILPDGQVLIAGGQSDINNVNVLDTAELYDPATGKFSPTGNVTRIYDPEEQQFRMLGEMTAPRAFHRATALADGRVLLTGGIGGDGNAVATAEIYDPQTGKFTATGPMNARRKEHTATLLADGRVLVAGGADQNGHVLASAEIFDPATNKFTAIANLNDPRYEQAAALLPSGQVLLVGGSDGSGILDTAELFDPARNGFVCVGGVGATPPRCTASMNDYRVYETATPLQNGEVVVIGGYNFSIGVGGSPMGAASMGSSTVPFHVMDSAEIYNPASGTFVSMMQMAGVAAPRH